jgi:hypothetical protein
MKLYFRVAMGAFFLLVFAGLAACAGPHARSSPAPEAEEAALRQRVLARWEALLAEDFETAHGFYAPTQRDRWKGEDLRLHYAVLARRERVWVRQVIFAFNDPTRATVVVQQRFQTDGTASGIDSEPVGTWDELWEKHDGQWWFVRSR